MNPSSLKEIIDLIQSLGAGAKEALIWYLAYDFGKVLLAAIVIPVSLYRVIKLIATACTADSGIKILRDHAGIGSDGFVSTSEARQVIAYYRGLHDKSKTAASK